MISAVFGSPMRPERVCSSLDTLSPVYPRSFLFFLLQPMVALPFSPAARWTIECGGLVRVVLWWTLLRGFWTNTALAICERNESSGLVSSEGHLMNAKFRRFPTCQWCFFLFWSDFLNRKWKKKLKSITTAFAYFFACRSQSLSNQWCNKKYNRKKFSFLSYMKKPCSVFPFEDSKEQKWTT